MKNSKLLAFKICTVAALTAIGFLLDRVLTINTPAVKINLAFLPAAFSAVLLGPVCGALVYGLTDLIGALVLPFGPYHPGFTVCAAIMGAAYGFFLYKKRGTSAKIRLFPNIIFPVLINCIIIGLFINTFWVSMLYGSKTYFGWFAYRLLEYAILVPVQIAVLPAVVKLAGRLKSRYTFL